MQPINMSINMSLTTVQWKDQDRIISKIIYSRQRHNTVNVDIFACINFRKFTKIGNFLWTQIRVFIASMWYNKSNFKVVYIFADI